MLGSVPPLRDCVVIRKSCHSGRAMECIARSGIQENEIISKRSRFLRKPESSIFKDFLDSPVPGSGPGQASRGMTPVVDYGSVIPDLPALARQYIGSIRCIIFFIKDIPNHK